MRYTEYHCGKAVIKDKALLSAAMQKLAMYEDIEENILNTEKKPPAQVGRQQRD